MVWITVHVSAGLYISLVLFGEVCPMKSLTCLVAASSVTVLRTRVPKL